MLMITNDQAETKEEMIEIDGQTSGLTRLARALPLPEKVA